MSDNPTYTAVNIDSNAIAPDESRMVTVGGVEMTVAQAQGLGYADAADQGALNVGQRQMPVPGQPRGATHDPDGVPLVTLNAGIQEHHNLVASLTAQEYQMVTEDFINGHPDAQDFVSGHAPSLIESGEITAETWGREIGIKSDILREDFIPEELKAGMLQSIWHNNKDQFRSYVASAKHSVRADLADYFGDLSGDGMIVDERGMVYDAETGRGIGDVVDMIFAGQINIHGDDYDDFE